MIIELVGLPGSGKTVCESLLQKSLDERGLQVLLSDALLFRYTQDRIYEKYKLSFKLRQLLLIRAIVMLIYRCRVNWRDLCNRKEIGGLLGAVKKAERLPCNWLAEDMLLTGYCRDKFSSSTNAKEVYLASEGLVQHTACVDVWAGRRYGAISDRWLERHSCDDFVILHLQTPIVTALDRFWKRGAPESWPPHTHATQSSAKKILERFAEAIEHRIDQFQTAGAKLFTVDNSGDMSALAHNVSEFVESFTKSKQAAIPCTSC